ncbi:hypothetical protein Q8A67_017940 [Cirrhinus molitorella]|uniref:Uncharacterized protein n=1 Tax=Cirrhinus molitorella TaxID=172907 RepID=A0AA88THL1_9TELE|nr:hypothetical protein Q8A67_017940 [Cirrhinus molitorella]
MKHCNQDGAADPSDADVIRTISSDAKTTYRRRQQIMRGAETQVRYKQKKGADLENILFWSLPELDEKLSVML